ncbi:hypothetical protein BX666DRAFT_1886169 [Dichotomocladium elegans]|nr:hypothetical protein BX666DRAFT_1886169 [Dichotomocladium elegans]
MQCPKRAIALRLNREALDLLQNAPAKIVLDVDQDNSTSLVIGDKRFTVNYQPSQNLPHQVYQCTPGIDTGTAMTTTSTPVDFLAKVVQSGTLKQVLSKEEKSRMRHLTEQAEREKNARRTELITTVPVGSSPRTSNKTSTPTRQRILSPTSVRASPSRASSTGKPLPGSSPTSARLDPAFVQSVRERLIHLLAIYPHPFSQLTTKLKIRETDLMPILKKVKPPTSVATSAKLTVAKKVAVESKGNWCLRPEVYKELRIWGWKRYDDKERNTVIKNAEDAYDALKLPRNAPERHNLVQQRKKASPQTLVAPLPHRTSSNDPATTPGVTSSSGGKTVGPAAATGSSSSTAAVSTTAANGGALSGSSTAPTHGNATGDGRSPAKRSAPSSGANLKGDEKRSKTDSKGKVKAVARKSPQKPLNQKQRQQQQQQSTPSTAASTPSSSTNAITPNSSQASTTAITSASATHTNPTTTTTSHKEPPHHPLKGRKQPQMGTTTATTKMTRTDSDSPATMTTSSSTSGSSETEDEDEDQHYEAIVVSPITTQAQFWAMCKSHDEAQQEYIRLKNKISQEHPLYVSALDQVDEPSNVKDEEQRRDIYYSRVKSAYTSHGGTEWRTIVQLTRQFHHQLNKVNALWDEVERAYQVHRFSLPSSSR